MVFADIEAGRQLVDGEILGQIAVDIAKDLTDLLILWRGRPGQSGHAHRHLPSDLYEHFKQHAPGEDRGAGLGAGHLRFQLRGQGEHFPAKTIAGAQHMAALSGEQSLQTVIGCGAGAQQLGGDVQYYPLIGDPRLKLRLMYAAAAHQHNIAGYQLIVPPLHVIASAAGEQEDKLMEFVVMEPHIGTAVILQMEKPKVLGQIAALFITGIHSFTFLTAHLLHLLYHNSDELRNPCAAYKPCSAFLEIIYFPGKKEDRYGRKNMDYTHLH